ncbi:MAG TPA: PHB depolymerase family esterase [Burkholderiales bacterium]|nr:PHB depolymerase family esterase [Burkholderiales bacterium]
MARPTMLSLPRSLFKWWKRAAKAPPRPAGAGRWIEGAYANDFGTRAYRTYVPAKGEGKPRALVVMLHGCKQNPDDFAAGTRMNQLADEQGFIVAYPEQALLANRDRCWNWFRARDQARERGEPSLIAGITREVMAKHQVDPKRVYVAGLSAGGAMAAIMGCTYPDLYAAVGVHSGLAYGAASDLPSALAAMRGRPHAADPKCGESMVEPLPTIVFHGDRDATVHPRNGENVIAQISPTRSILVQSPSAPRTVEKGEAKGRGYTRTVQADRSGKPAFEHWVVHGAGHAWSGGSGRGSFTDPTGPEASRAMLAFFRAASKAGRG